MKKLLVLLLALGLVIGFSAFAGTIVLTDPPPGLPDDFIPNSEAEAPGAFGDLLIGGKKVDLVSFSSETDGKGTLLSGMGVVGPMSNPDISVTFAIFTNSDPFNSFLVDVFNFSSVTQTVTMDFSTAIVLLAGAPTEVDAFVDYTNPFFFADPASLDPTGTHVAISEVSEGANPLENMGVDVGGSASSFPANFLVGPVAGPVPPVSAWDFLKTTLDFKVAASSSVRVSGQANITVIPEPSTYLLFGIGILGIIGMSYRQRRKAA